MAEEFSGQFEGDILMADSDIRNFRSADRIWVNNFKWEDNVVPYSIDTQTFSKFVQYSICKSNIHSILSCPAMCADRTSSSRNRSRFLLEVCKENHSDRLHQNHRKPWWMLLFHWSCWRNSNLESNSEQSWDWLLPTLHHRPWIHACTRILPHAIGNWPRSFRWGQIWEYYTRILELFWYTKNYYDY